MRYYKLLSNNYIVSVGTGAGGEEISKPEYDSLLAAIAARPLPESGYGYRLKTDLTWERYELPTLAEESDDPELTDQDALNIIVGGGSNA